MRIGHKSSGKIEGLGLKQIYKKERPSKYEQGKMRRAAIAHAKAHGDTLNTLTKTEYRRRVTKGLTNSLRVENKTRLKEWLNNKLHSLNPEKARKIQAIREAWERVKAREEAESDKNL